MPDHYVEFDLPNLDDEELMCENVPPVDKLTTLENLH